MTIFGFLSPQSNMAFMTPFESIYGYSFSKVLAYCLIRLLAVGSFRQSLSWITESPRLTPLVLYITTVLRNIIYSAVVSF